jgi:hypothetical protein
MHPCFASWPDMTRGPAFAPHAQILVTLVHLVNGAWMHVGLMLPISAWHIYSTVQGLVPVKAVLGYVVFNPQPQLNVSGCAGMTRWTSPQCPFNRGRGSTGRGSRKTR